MMLKLVEGDLQSVLGKIYTKTLDSSFIIMAILCLKMKGMAISLLMNKLISLCEKYLAITK